MNDTPTPIDLDNFPLNEALRFADENSTTGGLVTQAALKTLAAKCRELTAVTEQRDGLHELHNKNAARSKELLELCGTLREQRDRLAEALRKFVGDALSCQHADTATTVLPPQQVDDSGDALTMP